MRLASLPPLAYPSPSPAVPAGRQASHAVKQRRRRSEKRSMLGSERASKMWSSKSPCKKMRVESSAAMISGELNEGLAASEGD